jgi:hypothetical protein
MALAFDPGMYSTLRRGRMVMQLSLRYRMRPIPMPRMAGKGNRMDQYPIRGAPNSSLHDVVSSDDPPRQSILRI